MSHSELLHQLAKIETIAEDILSDKQQIVDLDAKRNKCRQAFRSLKSSKGDSSSMSWVCFGNTFIKMSGCEQMLESEQRTIDTEINQLRDQLKSKVAELHKMEGRPEVKGFDLKGMNLDDITNIT